MQTHLAYVNHFLCA